MIGTNFWTAVDANIQVAFSDADGNYSLVKCPTANIPSAVAGYAKGCILVNTTTGSVYTNVGSATSCSFVPVYENAGGDVTLSDDDYISLGTTTTNAATKVTLEFDKTTTGIGQFKIGDTSNPQVLNTNPGSAVFGETINILHSAGAGDCDDLIGSYSKVAVSGAGDSGLTAVGSAPRAYVLAGAAKEVYGSQPWISHAGTGAVTAMSALSAKCDVNADNFTASTINAGHFHVEGAATVTGQFDGAMIEVYPDVTCLDSGLAIAVDTGAVVTSAIRTSGNYTNVLELAATNDAAVVGAGTYTTADGYLVIKVGANTYRVPFFTAAD
jgi:hypothetical protein